MTDRRRVIIPFLIIGIVIILTVLSLPFLISGQVAAIPVSYFFEQNIPNHKPHYENNAFSVMTLNLGHGRGTGMHQILQGRSGISRNADTVAGTIKREHVDITALQEVDGPGFWNGGLDLIEHLAESSGCPHGIWTKNVETAALSYGTAILSDFPYAHAESYTFKARPFILPKGFTIGIFKVSENPEQHVCVVSVHLGPFLPAMRRVQARIMIEYLKEVNYPIVIAGDFNCGVNARSALNLICGELNLKAWKPGANNLGTHFPGNRRLDWILISDELEFLDYRVIEERLSDHSAVRAVIRYPHD